MKTSETLFDIYGFTKDEQVTHIEVAAEVETTKDADEVVVIFPKSIGLKSCHLGRCVNGKYVKVGYVTMRVQLAKDGVNGGKNESGIKRIKRFLKLANHQFVMKESGNAATKEQIEAAIS